MIKTVIFDLGGVIVPFDFKLGLAKIEQRCGHSIDEIRRRFRSTDLVTQFECGKIEPAAFVQRVCGMLDFEVSYSEFCDIWSSIFLPEPLIADSLLERIHERYKLLLLSNTNDIHYSMIKRTYPILGHFDDYVLSYRVGSMKPDKAIYDEAIARSGGRPGECFFIDDLAVNIDGARHAGMSGVQFHSAQQLEEELKARNIL